MCGRFVGFRKLEALQASFPIDQSNCEVASNYNVAPSQNVLVIVRRNGQNWLESFQWGLVPFWAKDISIGHRLINARVETVSEKPSFRQAFKHRRCLILADGFYEWKGTKGRKQPIYITLPDEQPFAFAGLWESWQGPDPAIAPTKTCTIITTSASKAIRAIHHRMPIVLLPESYSTWLDQAPRTSQELLKLLSHNIHTNFKTRPVPVQVNNVRNNGPENLAPMTQMPIDFKVP